MSKHQYSVRVEISIGDELPQRARARLRAFESALRDSVEAQDAQFDGHGMMHGLLEYYLYTNEPHPLVNTVEVIARSHAVHIETRVGNAP